MIGTRDLSEFIFNKYGIKAAAITPAKRGFYGETWRVQAGACSYFAKLDRWQAHKEQFRRSLPIVQWLARQGLDFIVGPVETLSGNLFCCYENGILALFPFVEGENREDYPLEALFLRLRQVYALDASGLDLPVETFKNNALSRYERLLAQVYKELLEAAAQIKRIIARNTGLIQHCALRLQVFSAVCRMKQYPLRLTHGDAGGNCILDKNRFMIIDWDQPLLAPVERDAWVFLQNGSMAPGEQIRLINRVLSPAVLDPDCLCFYCYSMFFTYMGEYLAAIRNPGLAEQNREKLISMLEGYFTSWILEPIRVADTIEPGMKLG